MQRILLYSLLVLASCFAVSLAKPTQENKSSRVHDGKLSKENHFLPSGEHNPEYDHEAFLGSDKKLFDHLKPEEAKRRLGIIFERIDKNKDGKVNHDELKAWIRYAGKRWLYDDGDRLWAHCKKLETHYLIIKGGNKTATADPNSPLIWDLWKQDTFGDKISAKEEPQFRRDRKRWETADINKDDKLSKDEMYAFIHPHQFDHMKDLVVEETMAELDTNKDGKITPNEYIADNVKNREFESDAEKDAFVKNEIEAFHGNYDKDKDGLLNKKELKEYLFPAIDDAGAEADHLIFHGDKDKDKMLTKDEMLSNFSVFVGSSVTEYGAAFKRHDEF